MNSQKKPSKNLPTIVGKFSTEQAAQEAHHAIETAGFRVEQISLETQNLNISSEIKETQALKSARGGAIAGGIFGAAAGFCLSLVASNFSDVGPAVEGHISIFNFVLTLGGAALGAVGFGLMGGLSGVNAPKEDTEADREQSSRNYLIEVWGTKEEVERAAEILRQQGGQL
ncbi:hypothetical protein IQ238_20620 [Pleurocapsales cyanobacterium LEGE 06147]|nr:hypothetical protein [Pleurocapsales cyanobacterium LEGE 06147]